MPSVREKWDSIYAARTVEEGGHAGVLDQAQHLLPSAGQALDLACGTGAASIFLARRGLAVQAWDISEIAVRKLRDFAAKSGLAIEARTVDITAAAIPEDAFDVVFVSRFLERGICQALARALRPGGLLVYQTFSIESLPGPNRMNPGYSLVRGELLDLFHDLRPLLYREDALVGDLNRGVRNEAMLVAERARPTAYFVRDWIRCVTNGSERDGLSAAIAQHRARLAALPDPLQLLLASGATAIEAAFGSVAENPDCLVFVDKSLPHWRVTVVPKAPAVIPTDLAESEAAGLGRVVDAVCESLRAATGAQQCRCWIAHPMDCSTRRMRVLIEPDTDPAHDLRQTWPVVVANIQRAIAA